MMHNGSDGESGEQVGYPADITIPEGMGVRNEDAVGDERAATVRGRYLARQSDLTDDQAHALAWRELGYAAVAIARRRDRTAGTIEGWLDRAGAPVWTLCDRDEMACHERRLTPMTREHLLACHPAVRLQYVTVAERYPSVVPPDVLATVADLTEHGTRSGGDG